MIELIKEKALCVIQLSESITIEHAGNLKKTFVEALNEKKDIHLNLENTEYLDASALQMICSLCKSSHKENLELSVSGKENINIKEAICSSGFAKFLGCKEHKDSHCVFTGWWEVT